MMNLKIHTNKLKIHSWLQINTKEKLNVSVTNLDFYKNNSLIKAGEMLKKKWKMQLTIKKISTLTSHFINSTPKNVARYPPIKSCLISKEWLWLPKMVCKMYSRMPKRISWLTTTGSFQNALTCKISMTFSNS